MIEAGFFKEDEGFRVIVRGHANYAPRGQDIVCAAMSVLFLSMTTYISSLEEVRSRVCRLERGYAEFECDRGGEQALKLACIGMQIVSENYPDHVRLYNRIWKSRKTA